jgi:protease I
LKNAGANWVDKEAVVDDNWVSSRGPQDIPAFNEHMIQLFAEGKKQAKRREPAQAM